MALRTLWLSWFWQGGKQLLLRHDCFTLMLVSLCSVLNHDRLIFATGVGTDVSFPITKELCSLVGALQVMGVE